MSKLFAWVAGLFGTQKPPQDYAVGQVWRYKTREGEEASRLYIARIDEFDSTGKVYHIYIDGVMIKNHRTDGGVQHVFPHAPVNENSLRLSLTRFVGTTERIPDVSDGYDVWKDAFDSNEGGVFNIPVDQIVENVEQILESDA